MANTAIYTEDGLVLNSEKCQTYSLLITDIGKNFDQEDYIPPTIQLVAQAGKRRLYRPFMK